MSQLKSLVWKEWHESRAFLWIGLGVFLGLPVIGGLEALFQYTQRFQIDATPWVLGFGGVLAVFVAVGATTRDFNGRLPDFWQSRPVGVAQWLMTKYVVGLIIVLAACVLPICVEIPFNRHKDALVYAAWLPFMWTAMYTLAFLASVLVRRMAQAAMLGLAAMLLVYFLPLVLPPLEWMNMARFGEWERVFGREQFEFAAGMLGVAGVGLTLALLAARRDWRIASGAKMMYGSVSAALLILFSSAAFQLGTNLPVLQQADLPSNETAQRLRWENGQGSIVTQRRIVHPNGVDVDYDYFYRTLRLTEAGIELGSPIQVDMHFAYGWSEVSPPNHSEISYFLSETSDEKDTVSPDGQVVNNGRKTLSLGIAVVGSKTQESAVRLWLEVRDGGLGASLWASQDKLYVMGSHLVTFDISDPLHPRAISDVPFGHFSYPISAHTDNFQVILPAIPGLSPRERLLATFYYRVCFKDDILCGYDYEMFYGQTLFAYRLTDITETKATFERISQNKPTMLESVFGSYQISSMSLQNGFLYRTEYPRSGFLNPHISVLDVRGGRQMRVIGHFAAPGAQVALPLPDGRCLVAGSKVWIVGPPPRRNLD